MADNKVESMKFIGWIEKILPAGDYDQKITVANYRDRSAKELMKQQKEFPNVLMFTFNVKNGANAQLDGINEGDKVEVTFFLAGKSGIASSTNKYYCINNLNVAKKNGITLIERRAVNPSGQPQRGDTIDDNDIPF